jgi:hypothetical protein
MRQHTLAFVSILRDLEALSILCQVRDIKDVYEALSYYCMRP